MLSTKIKEFKGKEKTSEVIEVRSKNEKDLLISP